MKNYLMPPLKNKFLFTTTMLAAAIMLLATAWMGDDAFITLRVIDNFLDGYGLRYNIIDRVQVFTHPLWLMILVPVYALTREPLISTMLVSVMLALGAFGLLASKVAQDIRYGCLLVLAAVASRSIYQYATSGLENPLTYLLLVLFIWQIFRAERKWIPAAIVGLLLLNRLDLAVLVGPALAYLFFQAKSADRVGIVFAATFPVLAWMVFSLVYFGSPFPNTAYAKLGTGYGPLEQILQGLEYTRDFVIHDPLLVLIIGKAVFDAIRSRDWTDKMLGGGIVLYLAYIVSIGGDFMSGRFYAAPGFLALCILARSPTPQWLSRQTTPAALVAIGALGILLAARIAEQPVSVSGIADERRYYYADTGLLPLLRDAVKTGALHQNQEFARHGQELKAQAQSTGAPVAIWANSIGMRGYYGGPTVYIMDIFALSDAFRARLPAVPGSRIGHYVRKIPPGYFESILDPWPATTVEYLRPLLNDVTLATRAPLFADGRASAIWRLSSGYYSWIYRKKMD